MDLKELEEKVERLRNQLTEKVGDDRSRLSDPAILPLSRELDALITLYLKEQMKQKTDIT